MHPRNAARLLVAILLAPAISAQQFSDTTLDVNYPGLSSACIAALNTTVECPSLLADASISNDYLTADQLSALCVDGCKSSLDNVRTTIQEACTAAEDVIVDGGIAYPATWVVDHFIYTYSISCLTDPTTGEFCDTLVQSWANLTEETSEQTCSDCILSMQQVELNSPLGYDDDLAESFASTTSSCGNTNYPFTSPTPYALNVTATTATPTGTGTGAPTVTATCSDIYTVMDGDTCQSVAIAHNVSTFYLAYNNNLDIYCSGLTMGTTVCIPESCDVYTVQPNDTCTSIIRTVPQDITVTQLQSWNPNINLLCGNMDNLNGTVICVSPIGGWLDASNSASPSTATTAAPAPTNVADGTNRDCGKYYTIQDGDYCASVSIQMGISLNDFYFLNPEIDSNCTNLMLGIAYCVEAVGDISLYANYTGGGAVEVFCLDASAPASCFQDVSGLPSAPLMAGNVTLPEYNRTTTPSPTIPTETPLPMASGTLAGCSTYLNYQTVNSTIPDAEALVNSCSFVASSYSVSVSDLVAWNPSLNSNETLCALQPGYSYCVLSASSTNSTTATPTDVSSTCLSVSETDIMEGTISTCSCYTTVNGWEADDYDCDTLASDFRLTVAQLVGLNPWLDGNCTANLYANLVNDAERAVCVKSGDSSSTTPSTTATPSATATSPSSTTPTPSDPSSTCTKEYTVVSGDSCAAIESEFGITFAEFYSWNPDIGSNCEYLQIGNTYCVAGPAATSTSTTTTAASTTTTGAAPTQTGIISSCKTYYTAVDGDSCWSIEQAYGITADDFVSWNPAVGSDCSGLWLGYSYCVGV